MGLVRFAPFSEDLYNYGFLLIKKCMSHMRLKSVILHQDLSFSAQHHEVSYYSFVFYEIQVHDTQIIKLILFEEK